MIKLVAAFLMLIDHVGFILFPDFFLLRIIGRLSMPLFAYSVARSFDHLKKEPGIEGGFFKRHKKIIIQFGRLAAFAAVSQFPFYFADMGGLNIGFTWLLSLAALVSVFLVDNIALKVLTSACVIAAGVFIPVDYGLYGVLYPVMMYICFFRIKNVFAALGGSVLLFLLSIAAGVDAVAVIRIVAVLAVPLIDLMRKHDGSVKVNKWFFYVFYPAHIVVLVVMKELLQAHHL